MNNKPIGVFDSGLGGLTVLSVLQDEFPNESFIYFGDTAKVPYGNKSDEKIIEYSSKIIDYFLYTKVKLIICACNTSSAIAIKFLQSKYSIPILDVITPVTDTIIEHTKNNVIGVIGTRATINSKAYSKKIHEIKSEIQVIEKASPLLVPIIENGWQTNDIALKILNQYLTLFNNTKMDCLILGCTHYPIMLNSFKKLLSKNIKIITSGIYVAQKLKKYLKNNKLHSTNIKGQCKFIVSDFPQNFNRQANHFLKKKIEKIEKIEI